MSIPIALRTRNRHVFLDVSLRSLVASSPNDCPILILDDCSDDPETIKYLTTNDRFNLQQKHAWPAHDTWLNNVGKIRNISGLTGIKGQYEIVSPKKRKGVRGGIFWSISYMMERFKEANEIIIFEADIVLSSTWYSAMEKAYEGAQDVKGPNGTRIGIVSVYNRKASESSHKITVGEEKWNFGNIEKRTNGYWNCANGVGGVMYLVTRELYEASKKEMTATYLFHKRSGDTCFQACFGKYEFTMVRTVPSECQHIGCESEAWPEKGWRYSKGFRGPIAFEKTDGEGFVYSDSWIT